MLLTLQTHFDSEWHQAATLELKNDVAGFQGASIVDYDLDYFIRFASMDFSAGNAVSDKRALSVRYGHITGNSTACNGTLYRNSRQCSGGVLLMVKDR